ncbi:MAG: ABC-2 family transporter protein [Oscillospiraceae bacterium]|nr:ABC-2 family transporter protein [Oscillospiraceae bacterium]
MRLYLRYFAMNLKGQMQYRLTFALNVFGRFVIAFATVAGVWFMFTRFSEVGGFTLEQVLLCTAVTLGSFTMAEVFARGFDIFPRLLGDGQFDRYLVRPRNVVFQVLASHMEFARLGLIVQAAIVFAYALPRAGVDWTLARALTLALMLACGGLVFFGLYVIYAALSFFTVEGLEFMNVLTHGGREFGRYPYSVYGRGVLRFLTFVVPLALFQYYPLLYLLGREDGLAYMLSPLLSLPFLIPCYALFRVGLKKYRSTGS